MERINLLPPDEKERQRIQRVQKYFFVSSFILIIMAIVLYGVCSYAEQSMVQQILAYEQISQSKDISPKEELLYLKGVNEQLQHITEQVRQQQSPYAESTSRVLEQMHTTIKLSTLSVEPTRGKMELVCKAQRKEAVVVLMDELRKEKGVKKVALRQMQNSENSPIVIVLEIYF